MKVDRRALFNALKQILPVTDPKASLPALGHVLLEVFDDKLTVTATDLTTTVDCQIPAEGPLSCCLPAKMLTALTKPEGRGDAGTVEIELDGDVASVVVEGLSTRLPTIPVEDFPAVSGDSVTEWKLLAMWPAAQLREALSFVLPAASTDEGRPHVHCVLLESDRIVATDGHRLHMAPAPVQVPEPLLQPLDAAKTLVKILNEGSQVIIARDGDQVRFGVGPWQLTTRLVDARFPTFEKVVPAKGAMTTNLIVDQGLLAKALARVSRLSKDSPVRLRINGAISIATEHPELGEAEVEVPAIETDHSGDDLVLGVSLPYLRDAIGKKEDRIEASFTGPTDAVRIDLPGDRVAVVMPVRL